MTASVGEPQDFRDRPGAALVSGGSGALGAAIARLLAARGASVAISYRSRPRGGARPSSPPCARRGSTAEAWAADLTDADSARALGEAAVERFGAIHTLVHAAGPHIPQAHLSQIEPATMAPPPRRRGRRLLQPRPAACCRAAARPVAARSSP